jgi:peptide chain release factor 2
MEIYNLKIKFDELKTKFESIKINRNIDNLKSELVELTEISKASDFWADQQRAQSTMQKIGDIQNEIDNLNEFETVINDIETALADESDLDMIQLAEEEVLRLEKEIDKMEIKTYLSGKFDENNCIMTIKAGQGGTEAMDWTEMLMRMYVRYGNEVGWKVEVIDAIKGTEAGYQTVTIAFHGRFAFGYLKNEHGTHRMVRNSPFNAAGARQTSFAGVEISPLIEEDIDIEIKEEDIEFTAVRSSGAGGQHVNKTSSKARIVHIPTGIAVESSIHRNQHKNKEEAMRMLKAKLYIIEEEKRNALLKSEKGEYKKASWGNQIRNYVFSPYKLVKDLRTGVETSQIEKVMDGELQEFIDAEVKL